MMFPAGLRFHPLYRLGHPNFLADAVRMGSGGGGGVPAGITYTMLYEPTVLSSLFQDSAGTTPVATTGDPVGRMEDQSGNGYHALQTVTTSRPTYNAGPPANLSFDIIDDSFDIAIPTTMSGTLIYATTSGTFWAEATFTAGTFSFTKYQEFPIVGISFVAGGLSTADKATAKQKFIDQGATASFAGVSNFQSMCNNWDMITSIEAIDTSSATSIAQMFMGATSLTTMPLINTSNVTNFTQTWRACNVLSSFPALDFSKGTNFFRAWWQCYALTSFPLLDFSSATSLQWAWKQCSGLTSFPLINTINVANFEQAWNACPSLTSFPVLNTSMGTNFSNTWNSCSGLTSFPTLDTSAGTNFTGAWRACSSLTSFPLLTTTSGTTFDLAWYGCSGLTTFPALNLSGSTTFVNAWHNCSSLASFPANMFDTCLAIDYTNAFNNCALDQTSVDNILVSIANSATTNLLDNGTLDISAGTSATPSSTGLSAVTTLQGRGWTVTHN